MKSRVTALIISIMLLIPGAYAAELLKINRASFVHEEVMAYEGLLLHSKTTNMDDSELEGIKVNVIIPELGVISEFGPYEMDEGEVVHRLFYVGLPDDAPQGEYMAIIIFQNSDIRKVKHRLFYVADECRACG